MGLQFKDLVVKKEISIKDLKGKVLAVDSYNLLYQFLTTIRAADGSALTDRKGRVTSHLIGLFNRTTALMEQGLKLIFVFDGQPPEMKQRTWEKRTAVKKEAAKKLKAAQEIQDWEGARKYASRTAILDKEMIAEAQKLLTALGLPIVQAPSEGEAQTAYMVKRGAAYASVSQDYDNLIFGCPLLIRNLSLVGKRKRAGKLAFTVVKPEAISLMEVLQHLRLELEQLMVLAILIGTDYNPGGVKGIGPKTALKLLQQHGKNYDLIFQEAGWSGDLRWQDLLQLIKTMPTTDNYKLEWKPLEEQKLIKLLVEEHDFSPERVISQLDKLKTAQSQLGQKGLGSFLN